ncbi:Hypothetical protein A7982_06699 [Minicystis rosea]|nr:Hypothetical protein A7982_06699 [Minicystis rosea]
MTRYHWMGIPSHAGMKLPIAMKRSERAQTPVPRMKRS